MIGNVSSYYPGNILECVRQAVFLVLNKSLMWERGDESVSSMDLI